MLLQFSCSQSTCSWFNCSWRRAVYLMETSVVLLAAQWFSSLVPVDLCCCYYCWLCTVIIVAGNFLAIGCCQYSTYFNGNFVALLISLHQVGVSCSFEFVQVTLKVPSCIQFLIFRRTMLKRGCASTCRKGLEPVALMTKAGSSDVNPRNLSIGNGMTFVILFLFR